MSKKWLKSFFCLALAGLVLCTSFGNVYAIQSDATPYTPADAEEELTLPSYFLTTANLRLRTGPSLNSEVIKTVSQSTRVLVTDLRDGEWYAVNVSGVTG
jgi:uncharacterized protein YgiM (DUF1202 family)